MILIFSGIFNSFCCFFSRETS